MPGGSFVDTNIWIYAHLEAPNDPRHRLALDLVSALADGVISAQVASEYYSVMLKAGREDAWIQDNLNAMLGYVRFQTGPQQYRIRCLTDFRLATRLFG